MSEITNSEALRDKIHELHNFMRNNGIGYGMTALKVFNLLYGLKKLDELDLYEKIGLTNEKCKWSYLLNLAKTNSKGIITTIDKEILVEISINKNLNSLIGYEIPKDLKDDVFNRLVLEIDSIPDAEKSSGELLSGKIYEYFIGRDQSAISELGAYFTNRRIVDFILSKIKINLNEDGSIPTMIDMFGGSGGFTLGYMNYLNNNFKIDWKTQIKNIYHYDINQDVIKSVYLEFFCLSGGIIPNNDVTIRRLNSFTWDYRANNKYKLILTNPPYGGDSIATSTKKSKRDKIILYLQNEINEFKKKVVGSNSKLAKIKSLDKLFEAIPNIDENEFMIVKNRENQLIKLKKEEKLEKDKNKGMTVNVDSCSVGIQKFAAKHKLTGNDKEACSLMLMMDLLDINGLAVGVLKEGLFFDNRYTALREVLIKNYNVKEVISVPQNQFENTSTKTSIIIFRNDEEIKTTEIKFSELVINIYDKDEFIEINDEIQLKINKGDIKDIQEVFISNIGINQILQNDSFSLNYKDYNKVSIVCGDDFKLVRIGDIFKIENGKLLKNIVNGDYPIYGGGTSIIGLHNEYNRENSIIISQIGNSCGFISFNKNKFYANNNCFTFSSHIDNNNEYYYYICKCMEYIFKSISIGSVQQVIKINIFKEIKIPIPKTQDLIDYWVDKISTPFNLKEEKEKRFKEIEEEIKMKIKDIQDNYDCEEVRLGDICKVKQGDYLRKLKYTKGIYPVYGGGNISNYINIYNRNNKLIINKDGISHNCVKYEYNKFFLNHHGWTIQYNDNYYEKFIDNYLLNNQLIIYNCSNGSNQKGLTQEKFYEIKIKIPKDKSLIDNLQPLFDEIEVLQKEIKDLNETYNQYLQELSKAAIKNNHKIDNNDSYDNSNEDEEIKEEVKSETSSNKSLTISELKDKCKELGIKGYSKKNKEELIEMIDNHLKASAI